MFDQKASAEGEIQVLKSKTIAAQAVDALKLYINAQPHRLPLIGGWIARRNDGMSTPGLFGMGGYTWADEAIKVDSFEVPKKTEGGDFRLTAMGSGQYQIEGPGLDKPATGRVGVEEHFDTTRGPVTLLVSKLEGEPGAAFDVTRRSRQSTIEELQKRISVEEEGNKSNVITVTLDSADPILLSATLNRIAKDYIQQNADKKGVSADKSLDYLNAQLVMAKRQMEQAEDAYNGYRNSHGLIDTDEEGKVILRQAAEADARLADLKRQRDDLSQRFAASHPSVVAINEQIASTNRYVDNLAGRVRAMPSAEQGALRLLRDVRVSTDLYTTLRNNIETLQLVKAGKSASVQLLDSADVAERPVKPSKSMVLMLSAIIGLFVGTGLAFLRDFLFKGVSNPDELESRTGLTVFATVPISGRQHELSKKIAIKSPEKLALAVRYPMDPAVEGLRMMRSALEYALQDARNNVVMLAGPLPGIGKSFVSANLSALLATGGKRVLLVDGDLRRGHLNQYYGIPRGAGLVDILAGTNTFEEVVHRNVVPNLDVLQCGKYPDDPAELLLCSGFDKIIDEASQQYDVVMLDAPALLAVSDTVSMAHVAGSIFLVARHADTRAGEIAESVKRLAQTGSEVTGILLNGFKVSVANYSQGRRYGGYAYNEYKADRLLK